MVQEIAQKIIATAKEKKAQDIYFIPKEKSYELHAGWRRTVSR